MRISQDMKSLQEMLRAMLEKENNMQPVSAGEHVAIGVPESK